jgi:very-short-patch-repair endonuclease
MLSSSGFSASSSGWCNGITAIISYCDEARLMVELDGGVHQEADQQRRDQIRDETLRANNLTVMRFSNERVTNQTAEVLSELSHSIQTQRTLSPT